VRTFFNSSIRHAAAAAPTAAEEAEDKELAEHLAAHHAEFADKPQHGTVLYAYGAYPFYGLLGTTILSKELFILDDNFPAVIGFGSVFLFFTWVLGPAMGKLYKSEQLAEEEDKHHTFDLIFALMDRTTNQIQAFSKQPAALNQFLAEYQQTVTEVAHAEVRALQVAAYNETLAKLQTIANQKAAEGAASVNIAEEVLTQHLFAAFQDAKLVDKSVEEAIDNLGAPKPDKADGDDTPDSIVAGIFQEYTESGQFDVDRLVAIQEAKIKADKAAKR